MPRNEGNSVKDCNCKKEIFAVHDRFYVTEAPSIPSNYVAYWIGEIIESWLANTGSDASNSFIHAMHGVTNGAGDGGVGTDLIVPFTGTTVGMLFTDVSLVQAMTDISATSMGLTPADYIYAVTNDNQPIWFLSPAAVAEISNSTYLHPYGGFVDAAGQYNKADVNIAAPYTIADVQLTSATGGTTTCTPIEQIEYSDICTGEKSYSYIIRDGNGVLVDASTIIADFNTDNIVLTCKTPADYANGCIERTTLNPTCQFFDYQYSFSATDLISFTVNSKDGLGNFNVTQEHDASRHVDWLTMLNQMLVDNTRMFEDVGNGSASFYFWEGTVANIVDLSPTQVQFDWRMQPGVYDTPDALLSPCIDPIPDTLYQDSAATLIPIYDSYPVGVPVPNGGTPITFILTNYYQGGGIPSTEHIPAEQVLTYDSNGIPISVTYYSQDTLTPIVFDPATDVFVNNCTKTETEETVIVTCNSIDVVNADIGPAKKVVIEGIKNPVVLCNEQIQQITDVISIASKSGFIKTEYYLEPYVEIPVSGYVGYDFDFVNNGVSLAGTSGYYFSGIHIDGTDFAYPPPISDTCDTGAYALSFQNDFIEIQNTIKNALINKGYVGDELIIAVSSNPSSVTVFVKTGFVSTNSWFYIGSNSGNCSWDNNYFPSLPTAITQDEIIGICREVEIFKNDDDTLSYYYINNITGNLEDASSLIGFSPDKLSPENCIVQDALIKANCDFSEQEVKGTYTYDVSPYRNQEILFAKTNSYRCEPYNYSEFASVAIGQGSFNGAYLAGFYTPAQNTNQNIILRNGVPVAQNRMNGESFLFLKFPQRTVPSNAIIKNIKIVAKFKKVGTMTSSEHLQTGWFFKDVGNYWQNRFASTIVPANGFINSFPATGSGGEVLNSGSTSGYYVSSETPNNICVKPFGYVQNAAGTYIRSDKNDPLSWHAGIYSYIDADFAIGEYTATHIFSDGFLTPALINGGLAYTLRNDDDSATPGVGTHGWTEVKLSYTVEVPYAKPFRRVWCNNTYIDYDIQTGEQILTSNVITQDEFINDALTYQFNKVRSIKSGAASIASGTYASTLGPDGTSWINILELKSITIRARKSNTGNTVLGGTPNQVVVATTERNIILLTDESISFSVEDKDIQNLISVTCTGDSAALLIYNYI